MGLHGPDDEPDEFQSLVQSAFNASVAAIAFQDPTAMDIAGVRDVVMLAILELARANQSDPSKLQTYAISKAKDFVAMRRLNNMWEPKT